MAIRRSQRLRKLWTKRRISSLRAKHGGERRLRIETLEERQLLAVGPQLVGIQPNVGELLGEGQTRDTAPQELRFLFNSEARIDPDSLPTDVANPSAWDSIQIIRSGLDGVFEGTSVFSDFGTAGRITPGGLVEDHVTVEFEAVARGQAGSLVQIVVDKAELSEESRAPEIEVRGNQIQVTLNSTLANETRATDLVNAINADEAASELVTARVRSGTATADIATPEITYSPITMPPADSASAISDFNASAVGLEIEVVASEPGMGGNGIVVNVTQEDLGEGTLPEIATSNKTISITLNANETTPTMAEQLIDALNADPEAGELVTASIRSGQGETPLGNLPINYSPIVLTGANDVRVEPGYLEQGDTPREVILRFKDHLPDDVYMIEVLGGGPTPLINTDGEAFEDGGSFQMTFNLDLGAQIQAVVPQPVVRDANGDLHQQRDVIHVYFNDDDLDPGAAENPNFYRLIYTGETVNNADDEVILPEAVVYDADTDMAVLTFSDPIEELVTAGTYRLRIGTDEALPEAPTEVPVSVDPGSSFSTAMEFDAADLGSGGLVLSSEIRSPFFPLDYPGGNDEPGHRDIDWIESHLILGAPLTNPDASVADRSAGIETYYYNFKDEYGFDPQGNVLQNAITEREKERTREIFDLYANYLGVNFIESDNSGFTIVTGDLRALAPNVPTGPGGVAGIAGGGMAIMDLADFQDPGDDRFGGPWFQVAMHEIGHLLGQGHTYDLPPLTIQGSSQGSPEGGYFNQAAEPVFPGDHDIVHGRHLHRPESNDIDLYRFDLADAGLFTVETQAQRLSDPSQLDTVLNLYKQRRDGSHELIARNDDYFNDDSHIELFLEPGVYFVGVSASGNRDYDPAVAETGEGGHSEGNYRLRLNFRADADNTIVDATGTALDGNADGTPGGVHNFWFRAAAPSDGTASDEPRTIFVDKANATADGVETGDGSLANPFGYIPSALDATKPGDIIRLTGNPGEDGDITTLGDNVAYQIGFSRVGGSALQDGAKLNVPKDVTLMIDANAILKLRRARIGVGSSSQTLDRSGGAIQVMGTPRIIDEQGDVMVDEFGQPIGGSVHFTSLHNGEVGLDFNPDQSPPEAAAGDWGGIVFRSDLDTSDSNRTILGQDGVFINYVNHAEMTYGGGQVIIDGREQAVAPLQMIDERPTLTFNTISMSSDMAMSATPNSFEEDNFHAPKFQATPFTSDYSRVGPEIHGNTLVENSLNGLFIRVATPAGRDIETVTKSTRWDDTDITHIVSENLIIQGRAGGPILEQKAPPVATVVLEAVEQGTLEPGIYEYKLVYVDGDGNEGPASNTTRSVEVTEDMGGVRLTNLPRLTTQDPYVARRIYRTEAGTGRFELVARINADDTTFVDNGTTLGGELEHASTNIRPRLAGRLAVDPGTVVKLSGSRIDAQFGGQFISEGVDGRSVVYTSLNDTRHGSGGTFDTNSQAGRTTAAAGDWGGIYLGHLSRGNIDFSTFAFGGGNTQLEGKFTGFNVIEVHQSEVRIANSRFEQNADGQGGQMPAFRDGRGSNDEAVIFVRGAQPVIVGNTIIDNEGSAIHINANSLNHFSVSDPGRAVGPIDIVSAVNDNQGPLVRDNQLDGNNINGMTVRGATLTTQGVWDDTDIVHVVRDTITVPDFHTFGGLRLESSPQESLVVKLQGSSAGFTATGQELDITDRIGGSLHIVGQPRFPVVLTSLADDSVGAGFRPNGLPQTDTNGNGVVDTGTPGDWRSVRLERFSNDRNVEVVTEQEPSDSTTGPDNNQDPDNAQFIGELAGNLKSGDDRLRLGFEVHGMVSKPSDVDVYSFQSAAGNEVWFDIDRTSQSLDSVVELVDADGNIIAQSDNAYYEELGEDSLFVDTSKIPREHVNPLRKSATSFYPESVLGEPKDLWSTNPRDAGMRVVLPGSQGTTNTYYVRVRGSNVGPGESKDDLRDPDKLNEGLTEGAYQLQVRLRELDEVPGSTVQYADIRYATNGIEVIGQPTHSPLMGEAAEDPTNSNSLDAAQPLGNLLNTERGTISVRGNLASATDVDFYEFEVTFDDIQSIQGVTNPVQHLPTILDLDYADGLARANTRLTVFDSNGNVVLHSTGSNIAGDQPAPLNGTDMDDLDRGSAGTLDPYIGTQELRVGTYYVAVSSDAQLPTEFEQFYSPNPSNSLFRLQPITSVERIAEDHIRSSYQSTYEDPQIPVLWDDTSSVPYHLGDVNFFVSTEIGGRNNGRLYTVDPFTGATETTVGDLGRNVGDIAMRQDGELYSLSVDDTFPINDAGSGNYLQIDTGDAGINQIGDDGISTFHINDDGNVADHDVGYQFEAITYGDPNRFDFGGPTYLFAVGNRFPGAGNAYTENVLYRLNAENGSAVSLGDDREGDGRVNGAGTQIVERGHLDTGDGNQLTVFQPTITDPDTGDTLFLLTDGLQFSVDHDDDPLTPALTFELNSGPEIRVQPDSNSGAFARDEDSFTIDGDTFEFDTGSVIVMEATNSDNLDGVELTITDDQGSMVTFEYDTDGGLDGDSNIPIVVAGVGDRATLLQRTISAINNTAGFTVTAELLDQPLPNRITLRGESATTGAKSSDPTQIGVAGKPGGSATADFVIPIEENSELSEYGSAIVTAFESVSGVTVGWEGERLNFAGAENGNFAELTTSDLFVDMGSDGLFTADFEIPFLAQDTAEELANWVATAVDAELTLPFPPPFPSASAATNTVVLNGGPTFESADNPLLLTGGGRITGIAFVNQTMYAVSDQGGLYVVNAPGGRLSASLTPVATLTDDQQRVIDFQGLSVGPAETESGRYQETLFGVNSGGTIHAFDTQGVWQPMFVHGRSSIDTQVSGVNGIAFSTLEENPWRFIGGNDFRGNDPGHGTEETFELAGDDNNGNTSLHFGNAGDEPNQTSADVQYDWPGGAHGSMQSNPFSLEGYSSEDKPVLYFTYFADTEEQSSAPGTDEMRDSLRVFIGDDGGGWDLLTTNNSYDRHELRLDPNDVQETYDNNTGWRQVRVELANYAGLDDLKLRVDFATAGSMNVGDPNTTGSELEIVAGDKIDDGDEIIIGSIFGSGIQRFEIEMGYSLVAASGGSVADEDTFQISFEDAAGNLHDVSFEFDFTGVVSDPNNVPVSIHNTMTAAQVATAMTQAIRAEFPGELSAALVGNRVNLPNASFVEVDSSGVAIEGTPGTTSTPIELNAGMDRDQVTQVVRQALADEFAGGLTEAIKARKNILHVIGHSVSVAGPFGLTDELPGDVYGAFHENLRGQNNDHEGIYLDDFIIGFAERGEVATGASGDNSFFANPMSSQQILEGPYQLEIRQGEKYGESIVVPRDDLILFRSFDTNDRLSESYTLTAPPATTVSDGDTFTLSDGVASLTFEFDDVTVNDGVTPGNVEIDYSPRQYDLRTDKFRPQTAAEMAARIRDAINSPESQAVLDITAALADGTVTGARSTSDRINLFGNVETTLIDRGLQVTETTTNANALRDEILGDAFKPVGDATYVGGAISSGFFVGGSHSIGIPEGIVLTTGDARFVEGPNTADGSSGTASGAGDLDLDAEFAPLVTEDSSVLEFDFEVEESGDLFFEFVFSSEEYNEFVDSMFNDVFGFFVDGENIGFVPGTNDPVTINTVNGGNPFGSDATNPQAYNNNDLDDGGEYLDVFGHDGFTDVFVASMEDLEVGTHTMKLAIADVGDQILDSAVFIRAFNITAPPSGTALPGVIYEDNGDKNLERDQGQVVIHSNRISYAEEYGVRIESGTRSPEGKPHPGPARVTRMINDQNLAPGVVVMNNLLARNATGGVYFAGDPNTGQVSEAPMPFGRIVNNTIHGGPEGGGNSVGIRVEHNASPTLLNNIVSDSSVGLDIDASSSSTVVGGTLFAATGTDSSNGNVGNVPLFVADSDELFVDTNANNFYLKAGAKAIDSSRDSLDDRSEMVTIRQPLGIDSSPVLAPDRDLYGQRRLDAPDVATPSGLGENVFKDRGAIDRSDFAGPSVVLISPQDNDAAGNDTDERATYLQIPGRTLFNFSIQVIDGIAPSNQSNGTGPDPQTVNADSVVVAKDGVTLEQGVDYRFGYNATSGIIRLTPLAGIWEPDSTYTIELLGVDRLILTAPAGDTVNDGDTFTVTDLGGDVETFEFESGYGIQVPAAGGEALVDGETFTITQTDPETMESEITRFELDNNNRTSPANVPVRFLETDTPDEVAEAVAAAIDGASLGLDPSTWDGGFVHIGGDVNTLLDTSPSGLTQSGLPGVGDGNIPVPFVPHPDYDADRMAESIASTITASSLNVNAQPQLGEVVLVDAESAAGIENRFVSAIRDLAGNTITSNRFDGSTAFTVTLGAARDYGDAPAQYPVLKADNGASHEIVEGYRLGSTIEASADGQPSPNANADLGDDGVSFSTLTTGYPGIFEVTAHGITAQSPGFLDAWIDFNADGDWDDEGEQILVSEELENGSNTFEVMMDPGSVAGETFARFRFSSTGGLHPTGAADDGEVEDYKLVIGGNPWHNQSMPVDTDGDDFVSPIDALLVIHVLNSADDFGIDLSQRLPVPPLPDFAPPPFYDVNGDSFVSPIDALLVIGFLNGEGEGEGVFDAEGESGAPAPLVSSAADSSLPLGQAGLKNDLLAVPVSSTSPVERTRSAADPEPTSSLSGTDAAAAAENASMLTGTATEQESVAHGVAMHRDVHSQDLEDLLDEIAADVDGTATEEAHDAFFAALDV